MPATLQSRDFIVTPDKGQALLSMISDSPQGLTKSELKAFIHVMKIGIASRFPRLSRSVRQFQAIGAACTTTRAAAVSFPILTT
jgi:hypothetical protein